jgi:pilus assembly protein CpaF
MDEEGKVVGQLKATGVVPGFYKNLKSRGIDLPIEMFEPSWTGEE